MAFNPIKTLKAGSKFTPQGQITGRAYRTGKKLAFGTGAVFGGMALYFLKLGAAAFKGFVIGATIGGSVGATAGGIIGFQIGVALAPWTFGLSIPIFTGLGIVTGGFVGATVGGVTGGLIGLGVAAGSTTAITMGVGAGLGGTIGAVAGHVAGSAVGGLLVAGCTAIFAGCAVLAPVVIPMSGAIGGVIGAYAGSAIGTAAGYVAGKYVVTPTVNTIKSIGSEIKNAASSIKGGAESTTTGIKSGVESAATFTKGAFSTGFSNIAGGIGGVFSTAGSFVTGAASAAWGGITGAVGNTFGFLSGAGNFIMGGLGSISVPTSMISVPVFGSIGTVVAGTVTVGLVTSTAFFNLEGEQAIGIPGQNEYFTLTKTSVPNEIRENPDPGFTQEVDFVITLTVKDTRLTDVTVTDEMRKTDSDGNVTPITVDRDGNPFATLNCPAIMEPLTICTNTIRIGVDSTFNDSVITNTATVNTTPEGEATVSDSVTKNLIVGSPPANCPRGWPSTGAITQGPEGSTSHSSIRFGEYEAIDIGEQQGRPVYATLEGTVENIVTVNSSDKRVTIKPTSCPGLNVVNFWHLSVVSVTEGQTVSFGQQIGLVGAFILDGVPQPHTHYQFNEQGNRSFRIEPPYIPVSVPRTCNGRTACNITISSAP
jgi:hypothetical protein